MHRDGIARGMPRDKGGRTRQVSVVFDADQFEEIRSLAKREGLSCAGAIRLLVEWGLEAEGESE